MKKIFNLITAISCALIGFVILMTGLNHGVGVGGDATIYMNSAQNLADGNGLGLLNPNGDFRLIPYFPPFFPLVLAAFAKFDLPLDRVAMFLNIFCFFALIMLAVIWTGEKGRSVFPSLFLGLTLAASPILIPAYSWAMSEPLAMLLGFAALVCIADYVEDEGWARIVFGGLFAGLAFLTRYACAAFIAAAALILLIYMKKPFGKRVLWTLLFSVIALLPMAGWLYYDYNVTQTVASRSMSSVNFAQQLAAFWPKMKTVLCTWILPESWQNDAATPQIALTILAVILALFPVFCLFLSKAVRARKIVAERSKVVCRMLSFLSILTLVYDAVILITALKTFPPITINTRMMLPTYIAFIWSLALIYDICLYDTKETAGDVLLSVLFFLFAAFSGYRGMRITNQNVIDGIGYNSETWRTSETVDYIKENIAEDQLIVTNEETALLYLTGRKTWPMHEVYVSEPDAEFYAYEEYTAPETDFGRKAFIDGNALLVVFDTFEDQMRDIYGEDTNDRIEALFKNLNVEFDGDDGTIYSLK